MYIHGQTAGVSKGEESMEQCKSDVGAMQKAHAKMKLEVRKLLDAQKVELNKAVVGIGEKVVEADREREEMEEQKDEEIERLVAQLQTLGREKEEERVEMSDEIKSLAASLTSSEVRLGGGGKGGRGGEKGERRRVFLVTRHSPTFRSQAKAAEMGGALQTSQNDLSAAVQSANLLSARLEEQTARELRKFKEEVEPGFVMLKHCNGKSKKHYKSFRVFENSIVWSSGRKGENKGYSLEAVTLDLQDGRIINFTNASGERLKVEAESAAKASVFAGKFREVFVGGGG